MRQRENLLDVVGLLYRRRRLILGVAAVAAIISIAIALLLPVYYKSTTTFLAASPDLTNPSKLFSGNEVEVYGTGNDLERLLGVATSEEVVGFLIDSFNLYRVYGIDTTSVRARNDVREELGDLMEVERNRYDAVSLSVEDEDPVRAAAMANAARERVVAVVRGVNALGQGDMAAMYRATIADKERRGRVVMDSIRVIGDRYNIVDVGEQAANLSGALGEIDRNISGRRARAEALKSSGIRGLKDTLSLLQAQISGDEATRGQVTEQLTAFAAGRGAIDAYTAELEVVNEQLALNREALSQIGSMSQQSGPIIHLLDRAAVPDRKSRPIRWLIVLGGTLAASAFTLLGVLVAEGYKDTEWRRYLHD